KLLDLAGKEKGSTVILPGRDFLLERTLRVPDNIHITAAGMARLRMKNTREDIFFLRSPEAVRLSKLSLCNARNALHIKAPAGHRGRIELDACSGWDLNHAAVMASVGNNTLSDGQDLELYFHDGVWLVQTAYIGNLNAVIDNLWLESKRYNQRLPLPVWVAFESVVFVNYGKLQLTDLLSVPMVFRKVERGGLPPKGTPEGDHRWVDNYGEFTSFNCRYGTEFNGHALVYHYGKARTRIYGGFGGFINPRALKYPGLVDTPDADFVIQNFVNTPYGKEKMALIYQNETGKRSYAKGQRLYNIIPDNTLKTEKKK
ncbi:MAG: hypothetical protein IKC65_02210, partial [Lentisphaeria bacterium]|nr:hypothetical protein [Lentisphaeria bacterium]